VEAEPGNAEIARKTGADEHRLCAIFIESFLRSQLNHSRSTRKIHAARDRAFVPEGSNEIHETIDRLRAIILKEIPTTFIPKGRE
jgi:hypothetical protein